MNSRRKKLNTGLRIAQIMLNVLLAVPAIGISAVTIISPDVPAEALVENTIVGVTLVTTAVLLVYDIFRPFSGGILLLCWSLAFAGVFNGFHLSEMLLRARVVAYSPFWSLITALLIMLGLLSVLRAKLDREICGQAPA